MMASCQIKWHTSHITDMRCTSADLSHTSTSARHTPGLSVLPSVSGYSGRPGCAHIRRAHRRYDERALIGGRAVPTVSIHTFGVPYSSALLTRCCSSCTALNLNSVDRAKNTTSLWFPPGSMDAPIHTKQFIHTWQRPSPPCSSAYRPRRSAPI